MSNDNHVQNEELTIIDLIKILLNGKVWIIIFSLIGIVLGLCFSIYLKSKPPVIKSQATIEVISSINKPINDHKIITIFGNDTVKSNIKEAYPKFPSDNYTITSKQDGVYIVTVTYEKKDMANNINQMLINEFTGYLEYEYGQRYELERQNILGEIEKNKYTQIAEEKVLELLLLVDRNSVNVLSGPKTTEEKSEGYFSRNIVLGFIAGLFFSILFVLFKNWWKTNKEEIRKNTRRI